MAIKAYPDPVTDILQVDINNGTGYNTVLHLTVCDNLGRICIDKMITAGADATLSQTIDMHYFSKGMYYLSVMDNNSILHKQVIVKE